MMRKVRSRCPTRRIWVSRLTPASCRTTLISSVSTRRISTAPRQARVDLDRRTAQETRSSHRQRRAVAVGAGSSSRLSCSLACLVELMLATRRTGRSSVVSIEDFERVSILILSTRIVNIPPLAYSFCVMIRLSTRVGHPM